MRFRLLAIITMLGAAGPLAAQIPADAHIYVAGQRGRWLRDTGEPLAVLASLTSRSKVWLDTTTRTGDEELTLRVDAQLVTISCKGANACRKPFVVEQLTLPRSRGDHVEDRLRALARRVASDTALRSRLRSVGSRGAETERPAIFVQTPANGRIDLTPLAMPSLDAYVVRLCPLAPSVADRCREPARRGEWDCDATELSSCQFAPLTRVTEPLTFAAAVFSRDGDLVRSVPAATSVLILVPDAATLTAKRAAADTIVRQLNARGTGSPQDALVMIGAAAFELAAQWKARPAR